MIKLTSKRYIDYLGKDTLNSRDLIDLLKNKESVRSNVTIDPRSLEHVVCIDPLFIDGILLKSDTNIDFSSFEKLIKRLNYLFRKFYSDSFYRYQDYILDWLLLSEVNRNNNLTHEIYEVRLLDQPYIQSYMLECSITKTIYDIYNPVSSILYLGPIMKDSSPTMIVGTKEITFHVTGTAEGTGNLVELVSIDSNNYYKNYARNWSEDMINICRLESNSDSTYKCFDYQSSDLIPFMSVISKDCKSYFLNIYGDFPLIKGPINMENDYNNIFELLKNLYIKGDSVFLYDLEFSKIKFTEFMGFIILNTRYANYLVWTHKVSNISKYKKLPFDKDITFFNIDILPF